MRPTHNFVLAIVLIVSAPVEADKQVLSHTGQKALHILLDRAQQLTGYVVTYKAPHLAAAGNCNIPDCPRS